MPEPMTSVTFPPAFLWGAATSAYQIGWAVGGDGRTPAVWDTVTHTTGQSAGG
ncbi:family 1 glycosylhydrolase, partial [Streptomyces sp. NPDC059627]